MLSTVLETDFTSEAMILRSFKSAIISLLSKPSSSASLWMRILMQQWSGSGGNTFTGIARKRER